MKTKLLFSIFMMCALFSAKTVMAQDTLPYESGLVAANADFALPSFWSGNVSITSKSGLDTSKSTYADFAAAIGIAADATEARAIRMAKTEGNGYSKLELPSCGTITLDCWGTGSRGIKILAADSATVKGWAGGNSYTAITVTAEINSEGPTTIYLVPTGKDSAETASTGDTYISKITITAGSAGTGIGEVVAEKAIVKTEYYSISGVKLAEPAAGFNIVRNIYEDGSSKATKMFLKD